MEEILKKAAEFMEQEKADIAYLEQVLERIQSIKGKSHPDTFADQNVF